MASLRFMAPADADHSRFTIGSGKVDSFFDVTDVVRISWIVVTISVMYISRS